MIVSIAAMNPPTTAQNGSTKPTRKEPRLVLMPVGVALRKLSVFGVRSIHGIEMSCSGFCMMAPVRAGMPT